MEQLVDPVSAIRPDYAAVLGLCMLLDDVSIFAEQCTGLDNLDGLV